MLHRQNLLRSAITLLVILVILGGIYALWLRYQVEPITRDGKVWFLEANANPYLGFGHSAPESAHKAGMYYEAFIQRIVDEAMGRDA